ncbi:MAG: DUF2071 domain-containing protein [Nitrososphaerota archaeon]
MNPAPAIPIASVIQARSGRWLARALIAVFIVHGLAMLSMAALLLPGTPGGLNSDVAARMAYVAAHPWLWRLGWLPWQVTALADLLLAWALLRTPWIARFPAWLALFVTLCAIIPDQAGQLLWGTAGVALAAQGNVAAYAGFERTIFTLIATGGGVGYTLAAILWSVCLARAGVWSRGMTVFSGLLWGIFLLLALLVVLPENAGLPAWSVGAGNAVSFVLLLLWLALAAELVLRRARPTTTWGRYAVWRYPGRVPGWLLDPLANSRFLRALCEPLPVMAFYSNIPQALYVNYLVPAGRVQPLVPPGLELQRVGPDGNYSVVSILTFRHGHFGPRIAGPLRRLFPSPMQSNWRLYVTDPQTGQRGVYFLTNTVTGLAQALGARLLSEGMPMHVPQRADLRLTPAGAWLVTLDPGEGSAPDLHAVLRPQGEWPAMGPWMPAFASYEEMLAYCVPQDRALTAEPWHAWVTYQEIRLDIPLADCQPLAGEVSSRTARALVGDAEPFSFLVPDVFLRFDAERHARWPKKW